MSAIQEISGKTGEFTTKVKQAKNAAGFTNQSLSEASGLSISTVAKLLSGASGEPKLSDAAALASTLNLSLDEIYGLTPPQKSDETLLARIHELEVLSANKDGQLVEVHARLKAILPLVYCLCAMCIVLAMCLAVYLLGDAQYPDIGLIQWGEVSAPAWTLIGIIVLSVGTAALLVYRVVHKEHKDE